MKNTKLHLKKILLLGAVLLGSQGLAGPRAQNTEAPCPPVEQGLLKNSWQALNTADGLTLLEATYAGEGESSGQGYYMHVLSYYNRPDLFTAVIENLVTQHAWIGVLERSSDGVYNWRNIMVSPNKHALEANFVTTPVFKFAFELDSYGNPARLVGTSLSKASDTEALRFWKMRQTRLTRDFAQGVWKGAHTTFTVISKASSEPCPEPRTYSSTLAEVSSTGRATANAFELRPSNFPGIYVSHPMIDADYERRASRELAFIVVHINGYSDGTWPFKKKSYERVLKISYAGDGKTSSLPYDTPFKMNRAKN